MIESTFLQKDDLILRAVSKDDGESFLKWHNDPLLRDVIGGSFPFTSHTFQEICNSAKADAPPNIWFSIVIGNNLIGIAGLHRIRYIQGNAEISLLIGDPNCRGKGFGLTALELLVDYAFSCLRLHRVYAQILSDNYVYIACRKTAMAADTVISWVSCFRDPVRYCIF